MAEERAYRILFLEDDPTIREVLTEYMLLSGYQVTGTERGDSAISLLAGQEFDLAVLDICVPGVDGYEVLKYLYDSGKRTAVIMLTALEDEQSQLKAFNLYADDYVIKPVSPLILLKRMETILRRTAGQVNSRMSAEAERGYAGENDREGSRMNDGRGDRGLLLKEEAYSAWYQGRKLPLTLSEYLLLQTLYNNPGRVYTREQLIMNIYNEDYIGNDRIIDAHVKNLRKKLPIPCIKTVIGVGYQFDADGM